MRFFGRSGFADDDLGLALRRVAAAGLRSTVCPCCMCSAAMTRDRKFSNSESPETSSSTRCFRTAVRSQAPIKRPHDTLRPDRTTGTIMQSTNAVARRRFLLKVLHGSDGPGRGGLLGGSRPGPLEVLGPLGKAKAHRTLGKSGNHVCSLSYIACTVPLRGTESLQMKDYPAQLEKLQKDAAKCALIRDLANRTRQARTVRPACEPPHSPG